MEVWSLFSLGMEDVEKCDFSRSGSKVGGVDSSVREETEDAS